MTICSLIVQVRPEKLSPVSDTLTKMEGVEIHIRDESGKIVVTIEHPEREFCSKAMTAMTFIDGVMSTALVYEHQEDLDFQAIREQLQPSDQSVQQYSQRQQPQ
jgi:nitrate reductase NapD